MKDPAKASEALVTLAEYLKHGASIAAYDEDVNEPDQQSGVVFNALIDWRQT